MLRTTIITLAMPLLFGTLSIAQKPPVTRPSFDSLHLAVIKAQSKKEATDAYVNLGTALYKGNLRDSLFYYSERVDTTTNYGLAGSHYLKGLALYRDFKLKEAISAFQKALPIFKVENQKAYLQAKMTMGIAYARTRQPEQAKNQYIEILEFIGNEQSPIKKSVYGNLGMAQRDLGNYSEAIQSFEKTIELAPEDKFSVANSYLNIATMFERLEMLEKANETIHKIDTTGLTQTPIFIAINNNLGENYFKLMQYELAEKHLTVSRQKASSFNQMHLNVQPNIIMSKIALEKGDTIEARNYLHEARKAVTIRPFPAAELDLKLNQSSFFLHVGKPDSAILLANDAITYARKTKSVQMLKDVYQLLGHAYEKKGDNRKANEYHKQHSAFTDSLLNVGRLKVLADARAKYELAEKEKALAESEDDKSFFESMTFNIAGFTVLLLVVSGLLYFSQRKTNRLKQDEINSLNAQLKKLQENKKSTLSEHLLLKSKAVVDLNNLTYIKSDGQYLEFYLDDREKPEVDRNTLKAVLNELPEEHFVQVHRSYIVNIGYVRSIFSTKLMLKTGEDINISRSFKANIENILIKPV